MFNVAIYPGKFTPPHRGHIAEILKAATQSRKLYVVVSHHDRFLYDNLYTNTPTKPITLKQKVKWLSIELSEFDHIKVIGIDESYIPMYPYGWEQWSNLLNETVPEPFEAIFGSEVKYKDEGYTKYFPNVKYIVNERKNSEYSISATEIRQNPYKHWEYILGSAREHFVKKVLITGTESSGKSTLTKALAKIFFTSWAREEGRYYSTKYFGGNESVFEPEDFYNICWEQRQLEDHAIRTANKIVFFDTDAVVTQFYCKMYTGKYNVNIGTFIDSDRYDLVLLLKPDVEWVADGFRWNDKDNVRWELHEKLKQMYEDRGFKDKIIEISGNYSERLNKAIWLSKEQLIVRKKGELL